MRRWLVAAVMSLAICAIAVVQPGSVSACSCAMATLADTVAAHDIAIVATRIGDGTVESDGTQRWTFDVDQVVKGDVPSTIEVHGGDMMCGTDFGQYSGAIILAVERRSDDEYVHPDCTPVGAAADLAALLAPLEPPDGSGPVAAVVAQRYRWSNLAALDATGRVLSWGDIGGAVPSIAACPGTALAIAQQWFGERVAFVVVDLATMTLTGASWADEHGFPVDLTCVVGADGAPMLIADTNQSDGTGRALVSVRGRPEDDDDQVLQDVADVVVAGDGTVFAVSRLTGGPVTRISLPFDSGTQAEASVEPTETATAAALDHAGNRLAVIVGADAVAVFDVADRELAPIRSGTVALPTGRGRLDESVVWLDDDTIAVRRFDDRGGTMDIVTLDGQLVSSIAADDVATMVSLDGRLLRANGGGLELVDRAGATTPLTPAPHQPDAGFRSAGVAIADNGPTVPSLRPDPPTLHAPLAAAADAPQPGTADLADPADTGDTSPWAIGAVIGAALAAIATGLALARTRQPRNR